MHKKDILNYLKSNQEYYHNQFGIQFIGLFGSFARDETLKPQIKSYRNYNLNSEHIASLKSNVINL